MNDGGEIRSPIAKFLSEAELAALAPEPGSTALFAAADEAMVSRVLGGLRTHLGRELELADAGARRVPLDDRLPALRARRGERRLDVRPPPVHRPDARRRGQDRGRPGRRRSSQHYDLIWNGWELGSGSIRIHRAEVQAAVFRVMGLGEEEQQAKFGFLLDALRMGAPPHGGFAMGIDRFIALMAGEPDIRQVIAFPKVSSGCDPLTGAPTPMPDTVLARARNPLDRRVRRRSSAGNRPADEEVILRQRLARVDARKGGNDRWLPKARAAQGSRR